MRKAATDNEPLAIYYAFKQSEIAEDGVTSAGWASFLQAVVDAGLAVDGTWPLRTELANRMIGKDANALASSIVLVCRKRAPDAPSRHPCRIRPRAETRNARRHRRHSQSGCWAGRYAAIGHRPGHGRVHALRQVLENDDSAMSVKTALSLINRVWEEIENELDANFDPETQVALAWFASYGFEYTQLRRTHHARQCQEHSARRTFQFRHLQRPAREGGADIARRSCRRTGRLQPTQR